MTNGLMFVCFLQKFPGSGQSVCFRLEQLTKLLYAVEEKVKFQPVGDQSLIVDQLTPLFVHSD